MLVRNHIRVQLLRTANEEEFLHCQQDSLSLDKRDNISLENLNVKEGDGFFVRIVISDEFDWYQADVLAVSIRYDKEGGEGSTFKLPWIMRPSQPKRIVADFKACPMWDLNASAWTNWSTEFWNQSVCL